MHPIQIIDVLAGRSCVGANDCLAYVKVGKDGKRTLVDGPNAKFRCYAASAEAQYPETYAKRAHNHSLIKAAKTAEKVFEVLTGDSFKIGVGNSKLNYKTPNRIVRVNSAGDFMSQAYFDGVCLLAANDPDTTYYAYTKSIPFWISAYERGLIPSNFKLTASLGGKYDHLVRPWMRTVTVVYSEQEAIDKGLEIDVDDSLAQGDGPSFALIVHGTQQSGTEGGEALKLIKTSGLLKKLKQLKVGRHGK